MAILYLPKLSKLEFWVHDWGLKRIRKHLFRTSEALGRPHSGLEVYHGHQVKCVFLEEWAIWEAVLTLHPPQRSLMTHLLRTHCLCLLEWTIWCKRFAGQGAHLGQGPNPPTAGWLQPWTGRKKQLRRKPLAQLPWFKSQFSHLTSSCLSLFICKMVMG